MAERLLIETPDGKHVATIAVSGQRGPIFVAGKALGTQYLGNVTEKHFSEPLQRALDEYRELIDDQVLSLVDVALRRIIEFGLVALVLPEGERRKLTDFQLHEGESALVAVE